MICDRSHLILRGKGKAIPAVGYSAVSIRQSSLICDHSPQSREDAWRSHWFLTGFLEEKLSS
ncbi:hypothetical protein [uncultured Nostoc sp.]|uniref:hypothetical protein n=1 Tax=uncultured Nostoc sp. TaxID=340711 RepID=UPI0035CBC3D7